MITLVAHNRPDGTWTHEILRRSLVELIAGPKPAFEEIML